MDTPGFTTRCAQCTEDWNIVSNPSLSTDGKRRAFERLLICKGTQAERHDSLITVATAIAKAATRHFRLPNARVPLEGEDFVGISLSDLFEAVVRSGLTRSEYGLFKCILYRRIINALRGNGGDGNSPGGGVKIRPISPSDPAEPSQDLNDDAARKQVRDLWNTVADAVSRLPSRVRPVATKYFLEGCDTEEIAAKLGLPVNTVRVYIRRARERLRKLLPEGLANWRLKDVDDAA